LATVITTLRSAVFLVAMTAVTWMGACGGGATAPGTSSSANVAQVSDDGQSGAAGTTLVRPLVVRVTDANGNPVAGESVSWAVASGGGSVAPTAATTGADGQARTVWTLGPTAGANTATATAAGLPAISFSALGTVWEAPPFAGTAFVSPDIITPSDPTAFESITATGQGTRAMFDRRVNTWITVVAHLFDATFDDGLKVEIQVNPEFDSQSARDAAAKYAEAIGRLPNALRVDVETVWIHQGIEPFGGGNRNILIHVGQAQLYEADGFLEEILLHEAVHTSLVAGHAATPGWLAAQAADPTFVSAYARDHPGREDLAETLGPWFAVRFRQSRIPPSLAAVIQAAIPHRLQYLDAQGFNLYPLAP